MRAINVCVLATAESRANILRSKMHMISAAVRSKAVVMLSDSLLLLQVFVFFV